MNLNLFDILNCVLNEEASKEEVEKSIYGKTPTRGINKGITRHRYVKIVYDDTHNNQHPEKLPPPKNGVNPKDVRIIQPYTLGIDKSNGKLSLRAFQVGAPSRRDHKPTWRMFRLDRIMDWKEMKKTFTVPAPGYNPQDKGMSNIIATAEFKEMDTLDNVKQQTKDIANAPKAQMKNQTGAIPFASQQKKVNVMTSQPNSQRYRQMANNVANRFSNNKEKEDYWKQFDLAQQEKNMQDAEQEKKQQASQQIRNDAVKPNTNNQTGPIGKNNDNDYDIDNVEYNDEEYK